MPSRNTIEIVINATDNASGVFNSLTDNTQTLGKTLATGIAAGIATAGIAIAGFAAKGIQEFTSFEQGIKEVFTLIPDASDAMKVALSDDVQYLADQFGILTDKQIPALYQALSAGIPPDNIFDFLTTANKAAVGGVVDLEVAVDGITSVINAYGQDVLSAAKASDIMFTGVRLGKTTFNELSQSLFQVIPSASALGVSFGDVTAALAAITSQGTPTSVATTQLRQLFVELSKAGGKAADTFQQLAGKTFRQFIAEGGNVQDALKLMEQSANASGLGINDLFSSVEAGNAALQLTGKGTQRFSDFLNQMADSAGATDKAFETMSDTIQFQSNRLQSKLQNLFIDIGRHLAPFAARAFEDLGDVVSGVVGLLNGNFDDLGGDLQDFLNEINPEIRPIVKFFIEFGVQVKKTIDIISRFFKGVAGGVPFLDNLKAVMYSLFPKETADAINVIIDGLNNLWQVIKPIADAIIKWVTDNVELKDVLLAVGVAIASFVVPAIISIGAAIAPIIVTFGLLVGAITLVRKAWETDFGGIRTFVLEKLIPALQQIADWFINTALPAIIDFVQNTALPAIQNFFKWLGDAWGTIAPKIGQLYDWFVNTALPAVVNFVQNVVIPGIQKLIDFLSGLWAIVQPKLQQLYDWFVTTALPAIINFIQTNVIPGIQKFVDFLVSMWNSIKPTLDNIYNWFVTDALPAINNFINDVIIPTIQDFIGVISTIWDIVKPVLDQFFAWFADNGLPAIRDFIQNFFITPFTALRDLITGIWIAVQPALNSFKDGVARIFNWIKTNVIDPVIQRIEEFKKTLQDLSGGLGAYQGAANNAQTAFGMVQSGQVSPGDFVGGLFKAIGQEIGHYNGLPYAPRDMSIGIHQGERVLTKEQNKDYTANQNNNGSPSVIIQNVNIGNVANQDDANDKARMFVNGLRLQGIEV